MRKKRLSLKETEKILIELLRSEKAKIEVPKYEPNWEKFQKFQEEVASGKRVLTPPNPTPEEWNEMVRSKRLHVRFYRWLRRIFRREKPSDNTHD